jgi:hypothetical protein
MQAAQHSGRATANITRDILYCSAAAAIGMWFDGIGAWIAMQGMCRGFSLTTFISDHFAVLPATSGAMLIATYLCCSSLQAQTRTTRRSIRFLKKTALVTTMYLAMMVLMKAGQHIAVVFDDSYEAVIYGSIIANIAFVLVAHAWRNFIRLGRVKTAHCRLPASTAGVRMN